MKNISFLLALMVGISFNLSAQLDRSVVPSPGPAPKIQLGEYTTFKLKNGLTVVVVENHKQPRVAFSLQLDRGPIFEGENAGYVQIAGSLLRAGTTTRSKEQLDEEIDFIGASLSTSSSGIYASSLTKHRAKLLELMTDVLYNPTFPESELEKEKKEMLSAIKINKDDPNSIAGNIRGAVVYGTDHPYGEIQKEEHVERITIEDCKAYYKKYFVPGIAYLAIVGDITPKEAKKIVKRNFKKWQGAPVEKTEYAFPKSPEKTSVALGNKSGAVQSVINVTYPVKLKAGDPDYIPSRLMNQILGGGFGSYLMQNLREDKAYTYGARSSLTGSKVAGSFTASASVRTEVTDSAITEFLAEMNRIRNEAVAPDELQKNKSMSSGAFARSLESPQTIANFALNIVRDNLPEDYYETYLEKLNAVSGEKIQEMAKKYIRPDQAHIVTVGNASAIGDKLNQFGEVNRFTAFGEPDTALDRGLLESMKAEEVIEKYLAAIGGKDKIGGIKSIEMNGELEVQGQKIIATILKKDGKFTQIQKLPAMMGGAEIKTVFDGNKALVVSPMGNQELTGEQLAPVKPQGPIFLEAVYTSLGLSPELTDVKKVEGANAIVVEFKNEAGTTATTRTYSLENGLLLEETTMAGTSGFSNYQEVDGIKFPHSMSVQSPMGVLEMKFNSITPNAEIDDKVFVID